MALLTPWTGRLACELQDAFRLSHDLFARKLRVGLRTVSAWHENPDRKPQSAMQRKLDEALASAPPDVKERFAQAIGSVGKAQLNGVPTAPASIPVPVPAAPVRPVSHDGPGAKIEERLNTDLHIGAALEWLDEQANWPPGTSRQAVVARLATLDTHDLRSRHNRRARLDRRRITRALINYYGDRPVGSGIYQARCDGDIPIETSILTRPDWLDLDCPLGTDQDALTAKPARPGEPTLLNALTADWALDRLAAVLITDSRFVNMPLYQLTSVNVHHGTVAGDLNLVPFVHYALTMDLLESELVDAIVAGSEPLPGVLPLRDAQLPDTASILDVSSRLCAGGTLALCAIARPARPNHPADYLLLIQERSSHVVNAAHRLAVIPKGFHQPLSDFQGDARLGATLLRETDEELFGREEIDNTIGTGQRSADPMHPSRLSEPMRWLLAEPDRLRMECTGFGLNLVSGNYEFPGLIVIDDHEFWSNYGGQVEANWESASLRQYSSLDRGALNALVEDVGWSDEGLFALLQGLRRLGQIGGTRVDLPTVEWEIAR